MKTTKIKVRIKKGSQPETLIMFDLKEFGKRIRELRIKAGLSIEELSEIIGCTPEFLGRVERGERNFSTNNLILFSKIFNVSTDYLLTGEEYYEEQSAIAALYNIYLILEKYYERDA